VPSSSTSSLRRSTPPATFHRDTSLRLLALFFPKNRLFVDLLISPTRPPWFNSSRGKHLHTLLDHPQPTAFPLCSTSELSTSSQAAIHGRPWPTTFHPLTHARSHQSGTPSPSSLSPCSQLREWRLEAPFRWSSESSCWLPWRHWEKGDEVPVPCSFP